MLRSYSHLTAPKLYIMNVMRHSSVYKGLQVGLLKCSELRQFFIFLQAALLPGFPPLLTEGEGGPDEG
jgi:hypothetical protein